MLHLKAFLIVTHLLGLTIGLGGATIIDLILCRLVIRGRAIQQTVAGLVQVISQLVSYALVAVWISGTGFLIQCWYRTPELLTNPKFVAEIAIVVVLTINGMVLHARVLPLLYRNVGRPLFAGLHAKHQFLTIACGAISIMTTIPHLALMREWA
jgi:ABC-type proline/glycine betaine transport system permease subunit